MPRYVVRYGLTRMLGVFSSKASDQFRRGAQVVARTSRGLEIAEVLSEATDEVAQKMGELAGGQVLREVSTEDENELAHIDSKLRNEFSICNKHVEALKLPMQLVDVERLFGGERLVVYYLSEDRVDFRELVKILAERVPNPD